MIDTTDLKKITQDIDKLVEAIDKHDKKDGEVVKLLKARIAVGKAKAEALQKDLKVVMKVVPDKGFHEDIHKGAKDAIKILDQMDGKFEYDPDNGDVIAVSRPLNNALDAVREAKNVKGLKVPPGLWSSIKAFEDALAECEALTKKRLNSSDRDTLMKAIDKKLAKLAEVVKDMRLARGALAEARVD